VDVGVSFAWTYSRYFYLHCSVLNAEAAGIGPASVSKLMSEACRRRDDRRSPSASQPRGEVLETADVSWFQSAWRLPGHQERSRLPRFMFIIFNHALLFCYPIRVFTFAVS
jgi:hypothetical protein